MSNGDPNSQAKLQAAKIVKRKTSRGSAKKPQSLGELAVKKRRARTKRPSLFLFTLYFLYKNLYILGITLMRRRLRYARRLRLFISKAKGALHVAYHHFQQWLSRFWIDVLRRLRAPFQRIYDAYRQQRPAIRALQAEGKSAISAYLPVIEAIGRLVFKILFTVFNYIAPIMAGWYLIVTINNQVNLPIGLLLEYNGQQLGYIQNESKFDSATQLVRERVTTESAVQFAMDIPKLSLEIIDPEQDILIDSTDLADMIFRTSNEDIEEAYGLYIDNRFMGAVTDKDTILNELDQIRLENATGKTNERIEFNKRIELTERSPFPSTSLIDFNSLIAEIRANEDEQRTYTVEAGDTPTGIADKVRMPYSELKAMNPNIEEDLFAGMEVLVQASRPFLSVKSIYTEEYQEEVPYDTIEVQNATYAASYRAVTQEGVDGLEKVMAEVTAINGIETNREILKRDRILNPIPERVTVGVNTTLVPDISSPIRPGTNMAPSGAAGTGGFIWPTVGGRATTYSNHAGNGIDIAPGGGGHPIYAAASGTVVTVKSGWTGYGNYIVINHGNGYTTLYAHNSANYVSVGDYVAQGQVIAAMGRTGWATGNHLHFEVHYNGRYMWPPDYVGYSG